MGRLCSMLAALVAYLCVGTILTQAIGLGYLWSAGKLDRDKLFQMLAVVHGVELPEKQEEQRVKDEPFAGPQPSFEDFERMRKTRARYLELKTEALTKGLHQLQFNREQYTQDLGRYERIRQDFNRELARLNRDAQSEGVAAVRLIWENIKPKLAKEQIMQMVDQGELDDVVVILSQMPIGKRAKIVSVFTTDRELAVMDELMRKIRQGEPEINAIDETLQKTAPNQQPE